MTMGVALLSPVASHAALALGQGYGVAQGLALALAALQAVAAGLWVGGALRRARWLGGGVTAALLLGLAWGGWHSAATGLLAVAGLSHALLYTALLLLFAGTLRRGRESLVTGLARRINPGFHAGMVPYTRGVTWAWCGFFVLQLLASAVLLAGWPPLWRAFVTTVHAPLVLLMAGAEFAVRRWRWRHEPHTGLLDTVRGVRRLSRAWRSAGPGDAAAATAAAARTSSSA